MSGLLFLTTDDFQLVQGTKSKIMTHNTRGFSLILFYSTQCVHCKDLIPIFKQLPGKVGGCQFGMINISQNKQVIMMSRDTTASIEVVPYIILYINGKPYMRYQGPNKIEEISRFIVEVAQKIQSKSANTETNLQQQNNAKKPQVNNQIPAYTIGKPLIGQDEDVCYLEFDLAYGHK